MGEVGAIPAQGVPDGKANEGKGYLLALGAFIVYTIAFGLGALLIFLWTDLGNQTKTTKVFDADDQLQTKTTEEDRSATAVALFTAVATAGWMVLPIKYAWDELAKNSDAARIERQKQAEESRATAAKLRDLIFPLIDQHYSGLLYRYASVQFWAKQCVGVSRNQRDVLLPRLLYSIAWLEDENACLRENGVVFMLRSRTDENRNMDRGEELKSRILGLFESAVDADGELVDALRTDAPKGQKTVSVATFQRRLKGQADQWKRLRELYDTFAGKCTDQNLQRLALSAFENEEALESGLNRIYHTWYAEGESIPEVDQGRGPPDQQPANSQSTTG